MSIKKVAIVTVTILIVLVPLVVFINNFRISHAEKQKQSDDILMEYRTILNQVENLEVGLFGESGDAGCLSILINDNAQQMMKRCDVNISDSKCINLTQKCEAVVNFHFWRLDHVLSPAFIIVDEELKDLDRASFLSGAWGLHKVSLFKTLILGLNARALSTIPTPSNNISELKELIKTVRQSLNVILSNNNIQYEK